MGAKVNSSGFRGVRKKSEKISGGILRIPEESVI
jgi:hypothetical protein